MAAKKRERHAQLPLRVLLSGAYRTLGYFERAVLVALCAEYNGDNNGSLALTNVQASEKYGIRGKRRFYAALKELKKRGLIRCTYQGKLRQYDDKHSPSRYALTFQPQNEKAVYNVRDETQPRNTYESWRENRTPGPTGGHDKTAERTRPQLREQPLPDPPADTNSGSAGGSPIRISPPRGHSVLNGSSQVTREQDVQSDQK